MEEVELTPTWTPPLQSVEPAVHGVFYNYEFDGTLTTRGMDLVGDVRLESGGDVITISVRADVVRRVRGDDETAHTLRCEMTFFGLLSGSFCACPVRILCKPRPRELTHRNLPSSSLMSLGKS